MVGNNNSSGSQNSVGEGSVDVGSVDFGSLDLLSQEVLVELGGEECGGSASTRELKNLLRLDSTKRLLYRLDKKLEPMGLVVVEQPELESGRIPPKVVELTELGWEVGGRLDVGEAREGGSVRERLDRVERVVDDVGESVERLERAVGLLGVATGVGVGSEQNLPSVVALRAGYTGIDSLVGEVSGGDAKLWDRVGKLAADEFREIEGEVSELSEVVDGVRGEVDSLKDEADSGGR